MAVINTPSGKKSVPDKGGIVYKPGQGFVSTPDVKKEVVKTIIPPKKGGGGGGGGGSSSPTPSPTITPATTPSPEIQAQAVKSGLSQAEQLALTRAEQIKQNYLNTGKSMNTLEFQRFVNEGVVGGGMGVKALRTGTQKEQEYYKKSGVSLQQERAKTQPTQSQQTQKVNIPINMNVPKLEQKSTILDLNNNIRTTYAYPETPFIRKDVIGYEGSIPIVKYVYVDPKGENLGGGATRSTERPATKEERDQFQSNEKALSLETGTASTKPISPFKAELDSIKIGHETLNQDLREGIVNPVFLGTSLGLQYLEKKTGNTAIPTSLEEAKANARRTTEYLKSLGVNKNIAGGGEFISGVGIGTIEDIRNDPIKQIALYGVGYGLGATFKGVSTGLSAIPKVGGRLATGFKLGATGYGVYEGVKMVGATAGVMAMQKDLLDSGSVLGVALKDTALLGVGFTKGEKGFDVIRGKIRTRGLQDIEVKQGEYPQLDPNKQIKEFQKNIYKEISDEAVAFHTTPDVFYADGTITPKAGTSELPGIYAGTQISTPFSKIAGSGGRLDSLKAFQQAIKEMFAPEKSPGVASLQPKGFREVKYGYSDIPQFEGQKSVGGKYAYFKTPPETGFMDIPKMKSEIEAIARIESGGYEATGKRFKVNIKGVDVPLDAFKYAEEQLAKNIDDAYKNLGKKLDENLNRISNKQFKPEEYPSYQEPTLKSSIPSLSAFSSSIQAELSSMQSSLQSSMKALYGSSNIPSSKTSRGGSSSAPSSVASSVAIPSSVAGSSSNRSNISSSRGSSSGGSSILPPSVIKEITSPPKFYNQIKSSQTKKKSLGAGFWVYVKQLKSTKFNKVNNYPLTQSRARDIGTYLVDTSVARTFQVKPANSQAQEDYQFIYIPEGYYESRKGKLRNYRVKNKNPYDLDMERFIEKSKFVGDTKAEIKQLQAFQRQVKNAIR